MENENTPPIIKEMLEELEGYHEDIPKKVIEDEVNIL